MTGSRKSALAAGLLFALIALLVLGGMAWATAAQLQLAERDALDRHRNNVVSALWKIEGHVTGILGSELGRPFQDYTPFYTDEPLAAWTDNEPARVDTVVLRSPITASGPPFPWIELYFHVDEQGDWTSPQLPDGAVQSYRDRATMDWLKNVLTLPELHTHVDAAQERDLALPPTALASYARTVHEVRQLDDRSYAEEWKKVSDFRRRAQSRVANQLQRLPTVPCVGDEQFYKLERVEGGRFECLEPIHVGVSPVPMAVFWLPPRQNEGKKLAFVRTGHENDRIVYQGFVADWDALKPELLAQVDDMFPDAQLVPAEPLDSPEADFDYTRLNSLPVRLAGASVEETGVAEARRETLQTLAIGWVVALAAMSVVGWGVGNLVSQTNRRLQFAYAVTHELRTPLTTFRLYADMLAAGLVPEERRQEYLDSLNRESERLSGLVQGVLEYARVENHRVQANPVDADAASVLDAVTENLRHHCDKEGVRVDARNDVSNGMAVRADLDLVKQIAAVLVDNAVRHARGSKDPAVLIRLHDEHGRLCMDVVDTGPGVERADARKIFKPFRRGAGAEAAAQRGVGLGLALARNWATILGGRLELIERKDPTYGGAHFRLTIPARPRT